MIFYANKDGEANEKIHLGIANISRQKNSPYELLLHSGTSEM